MKKAGLLAMTLFTLSLWQPSDALAPHGRAGEANDHQPLA